MRKLILLITLLSAQFVNAQVFNAKITEANFDMDSTYAQKDFDSAIVSIDANTLELSLFFKKQCPANVRCMHTLVQEGLQVKLARSLTDRCGITTYTGYQNSLPVDGTEQEVIVYDYSENACPHLRPQAEVFVEFTEKWYNRRLGQKVEVFHTFKGQKYFIR